MTSNYTTFAGKYRLEEEIANGGCGTFDDDRFLERHSMARVGYQEASFLVFIPSLGRKLLSRLNQLSRVTSQARIEDIQDTHGWSWSTVDNVVRKARRLQRDDHRSHGPFPRRLVQNV